MTYGQLDLFQNAESSPQAGLAKTYPERESSTASQGSVPHFSSTLLDYLLNYNQSGSSSKTCPVCCRSTQGRTWAPSSGRWLNAGTGSAIEFWTLSISESPKNVEESSLSDFLETPASIAPKYYLTPTACAGLLRRTDKRGRAINPTLRAWMELIAGANEQSPPYKVAGAADTG